MQFQSVRLVSSCRSARPLPCMSLLCVSHVRQVVERAAVRGPAHQTMAKLSEFVYELGWRLSYVSLHGRLDIRICSYLGLMGCVLSDDLEPHIIPDTDLRFCLPSSRRIDVRPQPDAFSSRCPGPIFRGSNK